MHQSAYLALMWTWLRATAGSCRSDGKGGRERTNLVGRQSENTSRTDLREKLGVAGGGVVFTTIQKFMPAESGDRKGIRARCGKEVLMHAAKRYQRLRRSGTRASPLAR